MTPPPTPEKMRARAREIAAPRRAIEAAFLSAGGHLARGLGLLNRLTTVFDALTGALQGADARDARARLDDICRDVETLARSFEDEKRHFLQFAASAKSAAWPIHDLVRSAKTLNIVSINAQITSADLAEDGADLQIFSTDIASLSGSAVAATQNLAQSYTQLSDELAKALAQRTRFEIAHAGVLEGLTSEFSATLETLESQRANALESSAATSQRSRDIAGRVANVVMALQVGDATRQRLEHIEGALATAADLAIGTAGTTQPAGAAAISALQNRQLAGAAADFSAGLSRAQGDLAALAQDAAAITARARDFRGRGNAASQTPVIGELGEKLQHAVRVLRSFERARTQIDRVARALRETVSTFARHIGEVQQIESEMRLVSLNATIRCAHLGARAAGLGIISDQLRELTSGTMTAAQSALTRLGEASTLAEMSGAPPIGAGADRIAGLERDIKAALAILDGLERITNDALQNLDREGPAAIEELEKAARTLAAQSAEARRLDALVAHNDRLTAHPDPGTSTGEGGADLLLVTLEELYRKYTMKAEREIHDALHPRGDRTAGVTRPGAAAALVR